METEALDPNKIFLPREGNKRNVMLWLAAVAALCAAGAYFLAHHIVGEWSTIFYLILATAFYFLFLSPVMNLFDVRRSLGYAWTATILYTVLLLAFIGYGLMHATDTGSVAIGNLYFGVIGLLFIGVLLAYFAWRASLW